MPRFDVADPDEGAGTFITVDDLPGGRVRLTVAGPWDGRAEVVVPAAVARDVGEALVTAAGTAPSSPRTDWLAFRIEDDRLVCGAAHPLNPWHHVARFEPAALMVENQHGEVVAPLFWDDGLIRPGTVDGSPGWEVIAAVGDPPVFRQLVPSPDGPAGEPVERRFPLGQSLRLVNRTWGEVVAALVDYLCVRPSARAQLGDPARLTDLLSVLADQRITGGCSRPDLPGRGPDLELWMKTEDAITEQVHLIHGRRFDDEPFPDLDRVLRFVLNDRPVRRGALAWNRSTVEWIADELLGVPPWPFGLLHA